MSIFNGFITGVFDFVLYPFRSMPPLVGLCVLSVLLGILLLLMYKYTSPQKKIKEIKDRIKAGLYEVRLYKDDIGIVFQSNKALFLNNLKYFGCNCIALVPLVVVILPIIIQFDARYGIAPLAEGEVVPLKVVLSEDVDFASTRVDLQVPDGLEIEAGPVRIPSKREHAYRMKVTTPGHYDLGITVSNQQTSKQYTKSIDAGADVPSVSPGRYKASMYLEAFESPTEQPYTADSLLQSVEVTHLNRKGMCGIPGDWWAWLWIFCIVGLASGLALKGVFKVTI